jgi:hypothetical protein
MQHEDCTTYTLSSGLIKFDITPKLPQKNKYQTQVPVEEDVSSDCLVQYAQAPSL